MSDHKHISSSDICFLYRKHDNDKRLTAAPNQSPAGRSLTGKKKCSGTSFPKKARGHSMCSTMVGGGWRLAVGGGWRLAVGNWWLVAVGGGWWLVIGGW